MRAGRSLLVLSIITRTGVMAILCFLALLTSYHNLKRSHNNPRLVEPSEGKAMRVFYEKTDAFFTIFGDPAEEAQKSGGMTWSIRLAVAWLLAAGVAAAHHLKGLPHYNYFENYPQVPEEEFVGEVSDYEVSLVVYDFQGINRDNVDSPDRGTGHNPDRGTGH